MGNYRVELGDDKKTNKQKYLDYIHRKSTYINSGEKESDIAKELITRLVGRYYGLTDNELDLIITELENNNG